MPPQTRTTNARSARDLGQQRACEQAATRRPRPDRAVFAAASPRRRPHLGFDRTVGPLHRASAGLPSAVVRPTVTASRAMHLARAGIVHDRRAPRARSGRMARAAPSSRRPAPRSSPRPRGARRAPSARDTDGARRPTRAAGARRTPLHLRKRRHRIRPSPGTATARRTWLASARSGTVGAHLVLAPVRRAVAPPRKAATRAFRRRPPRSVDPGPVAHALAAVPPAAPSPLDPPT
jgi:hypothetical protein